MAKTLANETRVKIIELKAQGKSGSEIARELKVSKPGVNKIIKKWREEGTLAPKKRIGRPTKLTEADKRQIAIHAKKNCHISRLQIKKDLQLDVCPTTISKALSDHDLHFRQTQNKPLISVKNRRARVEFAKKFIDCPTIFWSKVLFTDETRFSGRSDSRGNKVIRKANQSLMPGKTATTVKTNNSFTCWGAMGYNSVGKLVKVVGKMDADQFISILEDGLMDSVKANNWNRTFILQMDNDPKHTSSKAKKYLNERNIHLLEWPSQSPDLNPIEHLWAHMKNQLRKMPRCSQKEYEKRILQLWQSIDVEFVRKLINSMPRRLRAVIDAKGNNTHY